MYKSGTNGFVLEFARRERRAIDKREKILEESRKIFLYNKKHEKKFRFFWRISLSFYFIVILCFVFTFLFVSQYQAQEVLIKIGLISFICSMVTNGIAGLFRCELPGIVDANLMKSIEQDINFR